MSHPGEDSNALVFTSEEFCGAVYAALDAIADRRAVRPAQVPEGIIQTRKLAASQTALSEDDVVIETYRQSYNLLLSF